MKKKAYKISLEPSEVSDSIFIELKANSEFREHDRQIGYIDGDKVKLYNSDVDRDVFIDLALALIELNEETEKEPVVEEAPF